MMTVLVNAFIRMKTIYMSRVEIRGFNRIDRCILAKWSRKINCILKYIRTEYITDTNILIKALIVCQDLIQAKNDSSYRFWVQKSLHPNSIFLTCLY